MSTAVWSSPPPKGRGPGPGADPELVQLAAELKSRPGEWAYWPRPTTPSTGTKVNNGQHAAFRPAGAFEATSRRQVDGTWVMWVRYIGDPS